MTASPLGSDEYDVGTGYDEAFEEAGRPREHYAELLAYVADADLDRLTKDVNSQLVERGVGFGGVDEHPFVVDPIPRILTQDEWQDLSAGLQQRVRALNAFLDDVYGERRAVAAGVVPEHVVTGSGYLEEDLRGVQPLGGARLALAGLDLVRDDSGRFHVLEDNARNPSGLAYAMAASDAVADVIPVRQPPAAVREEMVAALRRTLEAASPGLDGELVLLTDGKHNSAIYEHERLARGADLVLTEPGDLVRRGTHLELRDGRRVRAVYRRTDDNRLREPSGALTSVAELLLDPLREGTVGLVNWFGNGVADDKHVYAYVDALLRFYLDEEPLVPSVPTYDLGSTERVDEVLDRLDELVVKPRSGFGGKGVVVGPAASPEELDQARTAIRADPEEWIAQDVVSLSTHPTVVDGRLQPRHVDLRPFVLYDGEQAVVPRGGLTRVALEAGSMVVNSSRQGGGKSTWVLD